MCRRPDLRTRGQQLLHAPGGPCGPHEVAINFRQRAKGRGHDDGGEHECCDRAARKPASDHIKGTLPEHQRDCAKDQEDDQRCHAGTQANPAARGLEGPLHLLAKARDLAPLLRKGLHNPDAAQHFGYHGAQGRDAVLAGA
jgi:hypothetical protein